jgi:hypothetical protein
VGKKFSATGTPTTLMGSAVAEMVSLYWMELKKVWKLVTSWKERLCLRNSSKAATV